MRMLRLLCVGMLAGLLVAGGCAAGATPGTGPVLGYSTWNLFPYKGVTEALCRDQALAMVARGLPALGYRLFIVDEPCFVGRDSSGTLLENRTAWPNGLAAFARFLAGHNMTLGIYTDAGEKTCQGCPGSLGFERKDMETFQAWGISYVKVDRCFAVDSPPVRANLSETFQAYHNAAPALSVSMILAGTDNCWAWGKGIASSCRTTNDIFYFFGSIMNNVDNQEKVPGIESFADASFQNDLDMLMIGTRSPRGAMALSTPEARTQMSVWAALKSPLLISNNVSSLNASDLAILTHPEVLAISQDALAVQATRVQWGRQADDVSALGGWALSLQDCLPATAAGHHLQEWGVESNAALRSVANGMCLSVPNCDDSPGQHLILCNCSDVAASANPACHNSTCGALGLGWTQHGTAVVSMLSKLCLEGVMGPGPSSVQQGACGSPWYQDWHGGSDKSIRTGAAQGRQLCLSTVPPPSGLADIFAGPLSGGRVVVSATNRQGAAITAELGLSDAGWGPACASVRDVWTRKELGRVTGKLTFAIPSHDTLLYVLSTC